jgi:hypothetical protein
MAGWGGATAAKMVAVVVGKGGVAAFLVGAIETGAIVATKTCAIAVNLREPSASRRVVEGQSASRHS